MLLKAGSKRRRNKIEMADYRREQDLREEAMFDKNELIRELEMEVARATSVLQSKSSEMNETKSKLVEA